MARDSKVRATWIEESHAEETGKYGVYIIGIDCELGSISHHQV